MRALLIATAVAVLSPAVASATVLTFDVAGGVSNFENVDQAYGDNVAAAANAAGSYGVGAEGYTPDVTVSYGTPGEDPALWTTGYGDLTNVLFNDADGDTTFTVRFTAASGYLVSLYGFDMASFISGGQTIQGFTVRDVGANTILFNQGSTFVTGATRNTIAFANALTAGDLELVINLTGLGGVSDDIGIDNVRFGQSQIQTGVPEPATWAMMLLGFGGAGAMVRRRRRTSVPA
ncbi:MAG: PEP-CTERM sorting domain-containing protein [Phenylobacterium sp.]|uniref:PEPxxWA-CTERM sorting domain-containing protein n=1 Tax=Phenylobacterium sp. TaxID=1871053 RepID=UPI001A409DAF|nr:PEPxxWA-CTERM sorting domain-containing protein [Phenylobacterium sp.]MBL8554885.1 PEP-CTERM sorting domain-containing protein [Phenylobacterium sp.]